MSAGIPVVVVPTGTANIASVVAGLQRAGAAATVTEDRRAVEQAERVVLPGVGTFGAAMATLDTDMLRGPLYERVHAGRPTLAICVGLQLLCRRSEESPEAHGMGAVRGRVTRFQGVPRVPQLGWNRVTPSEGCRFVEAGYAYFAHSYRLESAPPDWEVATADYGGPFVAAMERGDVLACQFHPELSSDWGQALLKRWLGV